MSKSMGFSGGGGGLSFDMKIQKQKQNKQRLFHLQVLIHLLSPSLKPLRVTQGHGLGLIVLLTLTLSRKPDIAIQV